MSILVMGIGVVSLATLFPISILRTAKANQLTNATIVYHNARALVATYPHLVHDPDNDAEYYTSSPDPDGAQEHYDEDADGSQVLLAVLGTSAHPTITAEDLFIFGLD